MLPEMPVYQPNEKAHQTNTPNQYSQDEQGLDGAPLFVLATFLGKRLSSVSEPGLQVELFVDA